MFLSDGRFAAETSPRDRILASIRREGDCWIWQKALNPEGRPKMTVNGTSGMVTRHSFEAFRGTIPSGHFIQNECGRRACVNPEHLRAVSRSDVAKTRERRADDSQERFDSRYTRTPEGCWYWVGARTTDGYGTISVHGRTVYAHRLSYQTHKGEIPDGMVLDHLCRVRHCVNPDHLEVVTNAENVRRGVPHRLA